MVNIFFSLKFKFSNYLMRLRVVAVDFVRSITKVDMAECNIWLETDKTTSTYYCIINSPYTTFW